MKLVQISSPQCGPCNASLKYVTEEYKPEEGTYEYVNIWDKKEKQRNTDLLAQVQARAVPLYILISDARQVVTYWEGYNKKKLIETLDELQTAS